MVQRRQPRDSQITRHLGLNVLNDGERMGQNVLVTMNRILLQRQRRQFGEELIGEPGLDREPKPVGDFGGHDHAVEFVADTFG